MLMTIICKNLGWNTEPANFNGSTTLGLRKCYTVPGPAQAESRNHPDKGIVSRKEEKMKEQDEPGWDIHDWKEEESPGRCCCGASPPFSGDGSFYYGGSGFYSKNHNIF